MLSCPRGLALLDSEFIEPAWGPPGPGPAGPKPTPVKIPLLVGELLLMDYMVLHAGMPFVEGEDSLRGHLYWAQVAGRDGEYASESTCFPWATYHRLYPSWRILSQGRRVYQ